METKRLFQRIAIYTLILMLCVQALCAPASAESFQAEVTSDKMVVREGATASSKALGYLKKGTIVTVREVKGGIAYIEYKGNYGFAAVSDMKKVSASQSEQNASVSGLGTVTASSIKVYASASTSARVIGTLSYGTTVTVLATSGNWARLQNGASVGYTPLSGLSIRAGVTATPAPAVTAEPTPVPAATATPGPYSYPEAVVTKSKMKVYASASTYSETLGTLKKNTVVTVLDYKDGWAMILLNGVTGYAKVSYMRLTGNYVTVTPTPAPAATATPAPTAKTEEIPVTMSVPAYVTAASAKVYAAPSDTSACIYTASAGFTVTVLGTSGNWALVANGAGRGYMLLSSLTAIPSATATPSPAPTANAEEIPVTMSVSAFVNAASAKVYAAPSESGKVIFTASAGFAVTVLGASGNWALVANGANRGYMLASVLLSVTDASLSATMQVSASVNADSVNVYQYASAYSRYLGALKRGAQITVLAYNNTWALIERSGATGYVTVSSLTLASEVTYPTLPETVSVACVISAGGATVYTYASSQSKPLGTLSEGEEITLLGYDDDWCLIERAGSKGYAAKSAVAVLSNYTLTPSESYTASVSAASATVYQYASAQSKILSTLSKGTSVTLLAHDATWGLIEVNGNRGYVRIASLSVQTDEFVSPTTETLYATIIQNGVSAYESALTSSKVLGTLSIAANVTVTAYTSKWARITVNGTTAYILRAALNADAYTTLQSGQSSGSEVLKMQKALENLGYFDGIPAGNYGSLTTSAVERFQTQMGVSANGVADVATLRVLYGGHAPASPIQSATLNLNDTGNNVLRLQTRLTYKGYLSASLDGEYGAITQKAVTLYQKVAGLTQSGTADASTLASLFSTSAPKNTSGAVTGSGSSSSSGGSSSGGSSSAGSYSTDASDDPNSGSSSEKIEKVIETALAQLGKPYIYGRSGTSSYDCSGLTLYCYKQAGVSLNRSAQSVGYNNGTKITGVSNLKRGDIVCFNTISDNDLSDHVGIYLGSGKFIHASSAAAKVVISSLSSGYYNRVFSWGRRVL